MNWSNFIVVFMNYFRTKRLRRFVSAYPDLGSLSVLDIGGRPYIWNLLKEKYNIIPMKLVLYNTEDDNQMIHQRDFNVQIGDGRSMAFDDSSFDLVFSNSVIEHVGSFHDMQKFGSECMRVGKEVYIQTPCKYFFVEPHLVAFFIHYLPRNLYRKLSFLSLRYISLRRNKLQFYKIFDGIRLLNEAEFRSLFPNMEINFERFLLFKKSMIAANRKL